MQNIVELPISSIGEALHTLRQVDTKSDEFKELKGSISEKGLLNIISVRPNDKVDNERPWQYCLVDGLHRFTAMLELAAGGDTRFNNVKVNLLDINENEAVIAQITANLHRIETKRASYAKALSFVMITNPLMSQTDLARKIGCTPAFISSTLSLNKLSEPLKAAIDNGEIKVSNGILLVRLKDAVDETEYEQWEKKARTLDTAEFGTKAGERLKQVKDTKRVNAGKEPVYAPPEPRIRDKQKLVDALTAATNDKNCPFDANTLRWVLQQDPESLTAHRASWDYDQKERNRSKFTKNLIKRATEEFSLILPKETPVENIIKSIGGKNKDAAKELTAQWAALKE